MYKSEFILILASAFLLASCRDVPTVVKKVPPTPHPARGANEQAARLYPDLAIKDSHFRRTFEEVYGYELGHNPKALTKVDWPLTLARRTAGMLGVAEYKAPPAAATPKTNPLERGAYDQRRAVVRSRYYSDGQYRSRDEYQ